MQKDQNNKIRVLIADDSFFMRKLLRETISKDPDIEVVGEAKDGAEAVGEAIRLKPDVITMDFNMPKMKGDVATKAITENPDNVSSILMVSAYTKQDAVETLESMRAGASDFMMKPSGELSLDINTVSDELIRKIKVVSKSRSIRFKELKYRTFEKEKKQKKGIIAPKIIIIGASTGGPPVVEDILSGLSGDIKAGIVVVQHMPSKFTDLFAKRLDRLSLLPIREAKEGDIIEEGQALIIPGDYHAVMKEGSGLKKAFISLKKKENPKELSPSIDKFMKSAAQVYNKHIVGIILTGMGNDGTEGVREIKNNGGYVIAQSKETSAIKSMPMSVVEEGLDDEVLPFNKIANRIVELSS